MHEFPDEVRGVVQGVVTFTLGAQRHLTSDVVQDVLDVVGGAPGVARIPALGRRDRAYDVGPLQPAVVVPLLYIVRCILETLQFKESFLSLLLGLVVVVPIRAVAEARLKIVAADEVAVRRMGPWHYAAPISSATLVRFDCCTQAWVIE